MRCGQSFSSRRVRHRSGRSGLAHSIMWVGRGVVGAVDVGGVVLVPEKVRRVDDKTAGHRVAHDAKLEVAKARALIDERLQERSEGQLVVPADSLATSKQQSEEDDA